MFETKNIKKKKNLTIKRMKRGETSVGNFEKTYVNIAENNLGIVVNKMVKISWGGGYKSLEVNNRANYKTNFYADDA